MDKVYYELWEIDEHMERICLIDEYDIYEEAKVDYEYMHTTHIMNPKGNYDVIIYECKPVTV